MQGPLKIAHVLYQLKMGGLENGVVNLINTLDALYPDQYQHTIICIDDFDDFSDRLKVDVKIHALHKKPGRDMSLYGKIFRILKSQKIDLVHTRNLAALDAVWPAKLLRLPVIHGEHGRDMHDLDGSSKKYQWLRRLHRPCINHYIALSKDLKQYLTDKVGVSEGKVTQIYNGVDTSRFQPGAHKIDWHVHFGAQNQADYFVIGTVARLQPVKNIELLIEAFSKAGAADSDFKNRARLCLVGDGPSRRTLEKHAVDLGVSDQILFAGAQSNIPDWLQSMDIYVLPSLAEGISNTLLEAQAAGLPVVASNVGGNPEIMKAGETGRLFESCDVTALMNALLDYYKDHDACKKSGQAARQWVESHYSLHAMVKAYHAVYSAFAK